jgi:hypothetical protein
MERDGGMDMLRDLTASQPSQRPRFLDAAPLSRLAHAEIMSGPDKPGH